MIRKNVVNSENCPVVYTAELVGDVWSILIIKQLLTGTKRFKELQTAISDISSKTLSDRLKMLEQKNLTTKKMYAEIPPRVEYTLTPKGQKIQKIIDSMREFGEEFCNTSFDKEKPTK